MALRGAFEIEYDHLGALDRRDRAAVADGREAGADGVDLGRIDLAETDTLPVAHVEQMLARLRR